MAGQVIGTQTRKQHRYAWLVAAAAVSIAEIFAPDLNHAGLHSPLVIALSFYLGVLGGLAWQRLNRVDLVDRFVGWAMLLAAVMLLPLLASGSVEFGGEDGAWSLPGVVVGVVLAEGWMRQRRRP
jgi:4-hydroxybenzoate polyprenyltransferase